MNPNNELEELLNELENIKMIDKKGVPKEKTIELEIKKNMLLDEFNKKLLEMQNSNNILPSNFLKSLTNPEDIATIETKLGISTKPSELLYLNHRYQLKKILPSITAVSNALQTAEKTIESSEKRSSL